MPALHWMWWLRPRSAFSPLLCKLNPSQRGEPGSDSEDASWYFIGKCAGWRGTSFWRISFKWDPRFVPGLGEIIANCRPTRACLWACICPFTLRFSYLVPFSRLWNWCAHKMRHLDKELWAQRERRINLFGRERPWSWLFRHLFSDC